MSQYFSPKEVAKAIGVSESSLKRWVDKGLIRASRTAGGHRRLELDAVLDYVRSSGKGLQNPSAVSLPEGCGTERLLSIDGALKIFADSILAGDEALATRTVIDVYLGGASVAEICDQIVSPSFQNVGDMWHCGEAKVYEERRACEICQKVVHELRRAVGNGTPTGPVAMGGTLDGDPYTLATTLAEVVLRSNGWNATSLGNMLPFETVRKAIIDERPALFWVSVTAIRDIDRFTTDFNLLFDIAQSMGTALVVGGQALSSDIRQRIRYTNFSDNFRHMESFARTIRQSVAVSTTETDADPLRN